MANELPPISDSSSTNPGTTNLSSTAQVPVLGSNFTPFGMNLTQAASVKLDKDNFLLWKNVIMPIVRGHGLEGYLLGTNECPHQSINTQITTETGVMVRTSPNPEYSRWMSTDQLLMGWLYSSMTSEIVMRVMGCNSSSELWRAINENYGILNRSRVTFLTSELQRTRKGSMSMDHYLSTIKQLADNLEIAGKKIEHTDLVTQVLAGLDEEYTPIVMQVNSKDQISWQELSSILMTFESRLDYLSQVRTNFGSINLTQRNQQNNSAYSGRGNRGARGHNFRVEQEAEAGLEDQMKQEILVRYVA